MEENEEFDSDFSTEDVPISEGFWNYMENYWHNNREFPESTESSLNKKADLVGGKVPASQLPSYVDDVVEIDTFENLPNPSEKGKIYLVTNNNTQFRWSGSGYTQLNSDEFFMTTNTNQGIIGRKEFITQAGNDSTNNSLFVTSNDGNYPAISFYRPGVDVGQLKYVNSDLGFYFVNSPNSSTVPLNALEFRKSGSNDDYILLGDGGHKAISDFAQSSDLTLFHKRDPSTGLNNASDTHTNQTWFDYNWANTRQPGSVINISGFDGQYSTELFASYNAYYAAIRSRYGDGNVWNDPMVLWHNKNFNPDDFKKIGARNLILNSKNYGFYSSDAGGTSERTLGEVTITGSGFWNAYAGATLAEYTPGSKLMYQIEIKHNSSSTINMIFYFYNDGDNQVFTQDIPPNVWTKVTRLTSPNYSTGILMGIGATDTDIGTKVEYRNIQVEEGKLVSTYRPAHEDFVLPNQLNDYWKKFVQPNEWSYIESDQPFAIINGTKAQSIFSGALLASNVYADKQHLPTNGIYSKGNIKTSGHFVGSTFSCPTIAGTQVINANGTTLTLGNPILPQINIETADANLFHYRAGYGNGVIWDAHNFNPDTKVNITDADNKYIPKTIQEITNFDTISLTASGIHRANSDGGGVKYLYSPMLHLGGMDTATQMQVDYNTGELSYRGGFNGGWNAWRTAWDSGNFNPSNYATTIQLSNYVSLDTDQNITGKKNFTDGLEIEGSGVNNNKTKLFLKNNSASTGWAISAGNNYSNEENFYIGKWNGATFTAGFSIDNDFTVNTEHNGNSNQWYEAYNWGNHAAAGYAKASQLNTKIDAGDAVTKALGFTGGDIDAAPYIYTSSGEFRYLATQTWVNSQGYLTSSNLNGYATESWVSANFPNQTLSTDVEGLGGQTLTLSNGNAVTITNNFVTSPDGTRNPDDVKPNTSGNRVRFDFANASSVKGKGNYAGVMTYAPWDGTTASTGDSSYQLAFANQTGINGSGIPMLKLRKGIDDNWSSEWYKMWSEGDFSQNDINNWNHIVNTAATQSWVQSQDYANHSFVEESLNKITSEYLDPDYPVIARSNFNTIIITDQNPTQHLDLESELIPGRQITVINVAPFDIEVRKDGNALDTVRSRETTEYYITNEKRLIKKGSYRDASILS